MKTIHRYYKVWSITATNALQEAFVNRWTNLLFILGKIIRSGMALLVLFLIKDHLTQFGPYTTDQLVVFFLSYELLDTVAQVVYRGVYSFGNQIRSGEFDFLLVRPIAPLFQALTGKPDINDAILFLPTLIICVIVVQHLHVTITFSSFLLYLFLFANAFLMVTALHIIVLVIAILTTDVDGIIWMYRDLMRLGQFPVSVYLQPLRFLLFFVVPIGMMLTIPSEVLLGLTPSYSIFICLTFSVLFLLFSIQMWKWGIKQYSSTGS